MKRIALPVLALVSACSQTQVDIKASPPGVAKIQVDLDELQCENESRYRGPWILRPFYYGEAEEKHKACLIRRGYILED